MNVANQIFATILQFRAGFLQDSILRVHPNTNRLSSISQQVTNSQAFLQNYYNKAITES